MNAIGTQMPDPINSGLSRWRMAALNKYINAAAELGRNPISKADSYAYEKLIRKWTKSVFFGFFQSYGYENGPDSYGQIRLSFS